MKLGNYYKAPIKITKELSFLQKLFKFSFIITEAIFTVILLWILIVFFSVL